jgi:hypothetical protein
MSLPREILGLDLEAEQRESREAQDRMSVIGYLAVALLLGLAVSLVATAPLWGPIVDAAWPAVGAWADRGAP